MEALKMEKPMTEWNNDRLDEMNERMKDGFAEADKRFEQMATKDEMAEVRAQLNRLNDRFDRFLFIFLGACVGLVGSFLVAAFSLAFQG
jgi:tetrahydromethanopterin S-methyltransferase subunit G